MPKDKIGTTGGMKGTQGNISYQGRWWVGSGIKVEGQKPGEKVTMFS